MEENIKLCFFMVVSIVMSVMISVHCVLLIGTKLGWSHREVCPDIGFFSYGKSPKFANLDLAGAVL